MDVTLDPDTAHPDLILSDDGKQVRVETLDRNSQTNQRDLILLCLGKGGILLREILF